MQHAYACGQKHGTRLPAPDTKTPPIKQTSSKGNSQTPPPKQPPEAAPEAPPTPKPPVTAKDKPKTPNSDPPDPNGNNKPVKLTLDEVAKLPKGQRPDPSTYLAPEFIEAHLAKFRSGVAKIMKNAPEQNVGPPSGTYVLTKSDADRIITSAAGDVRKIEQALGLDAGDLGNCPVRIDIPSPENLRMPSGNERGANYYWRPGGQTSGGLPEAVIDPAVPCTYNVTFIPVNKTGE